MSLPDRVHELTESEKRELEELDQMLHETIDSDDAESALLDDLRQAEEA